MKKLFLAVLAIALFSTASAQEFKYGAKLGMNIASLGGDTEDLKSRIGLTLGVMGEYQLNDKMSVSADLLFSQQGAKYSESESGDGYSYEYTAKQNLSYLNIPILFNYYVIEGLAIKAGIQPGFLLSAKAKYEYSGDEGSESGDEDMKEYCSGIDFAIPIGVSYDITENIVVDARYNIGLSNLYKDSGDYKVTNGVFTISVGYKF